MIVREEYEGIEYVLYLPDAFLGEEKLPLITLFRAGPEEWFQSRQDDSRGKRNLFTLTIDLIEKSFLKPCGFLFPRTNTRDGSRYYFSKGPFVQEPKGEAVLSQQFFEEKLLPHLAENYPVDIERVSLDGFSLGGYTALSYSFTNPQRYKSTGCFDGALLDFHFDNRSISPDTPSDLCFDEFPYLFDAEPSEEYFRSQNPLDLAQRGQFPPNLFVMASADTHPTSNRPRMEKLAEFMHNHGVVNHAQELIIDENSRHEWYWVDEYLYRALPFHSHKLQEESE